MFKHNVKQLLSLISLSAFLALAQPVWAQDMADSARVDINQASATELAEMLDGVGLVRAEAIVDWREANGEFLTLDDLTKVDGIGPSILEMNRARMMLAPN